MKNKVKLVFKNSQQEIQEENVWVKKKGNHFVIDNIPFFAPNIALNDVISVEKDNDILYLEEIVEFSGHSTIQIIIINEKTIDSLLKQLESFGCKWEGMNNQRLIAVDIEPETIYLPIKEYLENELLNMNLDYKESCLSENHKY
jgi:hypothetical protein